MIWQYGLVLEKYWMTQSGYLRLATTVELGTGITDGKLLFCHGVSEGNLYNRILTREYNNRKFYDCFNNILPDDFGSPGLNLPPIIIDDIPHPNKRACYTPYMITATIAVASENYVSTLNTHSHFTRTLILPSNDPNPHYEMNKYEPFRVRLKRGYCYRKHDEKNSTKRRGYISPHAPIKTRTFIIVMSFPWLINRRVIYSWNIKMYVTNIQLLFCFSPL